MGVRVPDLRVLAGVLSLTATLAACNATKHADSASGLPEAVHAIAGTPSPFVAVPVPSVSPSAQATVAPLVNRVDPDVFVLADAPLTATQIAAVTAIAPGGDIFPVAVGNVQVASGTTEAIGVDPSTYRRFAPDNTAQVDGLWQSVADGEVSVAHTVAAATNVALGATLPVTGPSGAPDALRVGSYATTGLPGIGALVDRAVGAQLGLVDNRGLLVRAPGKDPVVTAALVSSALGTTGFQVTPLRVPTTNGKLQWVPPAIGPITNGFGPRTSPITGASEFHMGIDVGAGFGSPIYAASAGSVEYAGPAEGFGNEVILQHANGVQTVYGHMEKILVTSGPVTAGQPIALVGSEGESTGPHLHFEVHVNDTPVDPLIWLTQHGVKLS